MAESNLSALLLLRQPWWPKTVGDHPLKLANVLRALGVITKRIGNHEGAGVDVGEIDQHYLVHGRVRKAPNVASHPASWLVEWTIEASRWVHQDLGRGPFGRCRKETADGPALPAELCNRTVPG